jgi:hypothetical protein
MSQTPYHNTTGCHDGDFVVFDESDMDELSENECVSGDVSIVDVGGMKSINFGNVTEIRGRLFIISNNELSEINAHHSMSIGQGLSFPRVKVKNNRKLSLCDSLEFIKSDTDVGSSYHSSGNLPDGCW